MIKYLELTAPEENQFRQAKILSVEVSEGDHVEVGDTLFRVKTSSGKTDLPSTKAGVVTEVIAMVDENISSMTPLILLATEVEESTASKPLNDYPGNPLTTPFPPAEIEQDQTETSDTKESLVEEPSADKKEPSADEKEPSADKKEPSADKRKPKASKKKKAQKKNKKAKQHKQQNLDLGEDVETNLEDKQNSAEEDTSTDNSMPPSENQPEHMDSEPTVDTKPTTNDQTITVRIPDIGGDTARVVDILIQVGDNVELEQSLITLESDKASMEVPCTHAGVVNAVKLELEQEVSEGDAIIELTESEPEQASNSADKATKAETEKQEPATEQNIDSQSLHQVTIPDIGGDPAQVVEILVSIGQTVNIDDSLITLESDKASMDVPSSATGEIQSIDVELEQEVNEGTLIVTILGKADTQQSSTSKPETGSGLSANRAEPSDDKAQASPPAGKEKPDAAGSPANSATAGSGKSHASPSIRRFARELGVQLSKVNGTGRKGRISKADVKKYVKGVLTSTPTSSKPGSSDSSGIPAVPAVDFSKFGEIDIQPLNRIKRLTASNLHRSWLNVPHVTHSDESNISELDTFRKQLNEEYKAQGRAVKLSPLAFIVKAVVNALQNFPQFNSSLEPGGENLIYKKYINIGIAVETPNGLVVPVIKDADKKSVRALAESMGELAAKARDNKLSMSDMSGSCFTISSLGGIGGTHFTPIVNAPEVAILGVSRTKVQPHWNGEEFEPAQILPLSLSYDHRVIDGAEAARFTRHIATVLEDVRRLTV